MERKCSISIYTRRVCSYLFFSSVVLAHLFRRKSEDASRGEPAQVPSPPPLKGLLRARVQDSVLCTWSQVALGDGHGAGDCGGTGRALVGPGVGGWQGQPCMG